MGTPSMRCFLPYVLMLLICVTGVYADLQNIEVGGTIRIRGRYWSNTYTDGGGEVRIPDFFLPGRPIGVQGVVSRFRYDDHSNSLTYVEQNTKLRVNADFTNEVNAVIEFDDYERWGGGDFRSDYVTGADSRANSSDDVEIIQSYIETNETFGLPLRARIGRQQIKLGDGWLVGETQSAVEQAFDGIRLTYDAGPFAIDGWYTKLAETGAAEEDGDVDFYGLAASYAGLEDHEWTLYWLYLRDPRSLNDTNFSARIEWIENALGLDDYDPTRLHTFGVRGAGRIGQLEYILELAYQTGNADAVGALFRPFLYGDNGAEFDSWAGELELGYHFDVRWQSYLYILGTYFDGEDNRDLSFVEWVNPFDRPEASVSFNRLFSSVKYYELFDEGRNASNFNQVKLGVAVQPLDKISGDASVAVLRANAVFEHPLSVGLGGFRVPVAPALAFLSEPADRDIGVLTQLGIRYQYSENLALGLMWQHLFTADDVDEGNFILSNGLEFLGGTDSDDADYLSFETRITF